MTRPLLVRFGAMGDMVLMTVAIRRIAERFGSSVDVLGSGEWTGPLLHRQFGVGDIFLVRSRSSSYWIDPEQWRLVRELRNRGASPTWLFDARVKKVRWLLERAGWQNKDLIALDRLPDIAGEHFCDRWRRFADLSPDSAISPTMTAGAGRRIEARPQLTVLDEFRAETASWLSDLGIDGRPFILIQPGNKQTMRRVNRRRPSNTKYWPEPRWAAVLRGLRALHPEYALLMLGVASEAYVNDEILALARVANSHNLARAMTVPRLMALSERAFGMISVDTGPAHVAAALGCPLVVMFDSPSKLIMYAPRGFGPSARCIVGGADDAPSLLGLTDQFVVEEWTHMLSALEGRARHVPAKRVALGDVPFENTTLPTPTEERRP